jgi:hypothetical protein
MSHKGLEVIAQSIMVLVLINVPARPYGMTWDKKDPFHQPATTTNYYGSGDIDLDGDVDGADRDAAQTMIGPSATIPSNYRADVNADGLIDNNDISLYDYYLSSPFDRYLPGWWNSLTTREERISWIRNLISNVYKDNYRAGYVFPWHVCEQFAGQFLLLCTFDRGDRSLTNKDGPYIDLAQNGQPLFNLPCFKVSAMVPDIFGGADRPHAEAMVLVGDNPLDISDYIVINCIDAEIYPTCPPTAWRYVRMHATSDIEWDDAGVLTQSPSQDFRTFRGVTPSDPISNGIDQKRPLISELNNGTLFFEQQSEDVLVRHHEIFLKSLHGTAPVRVLTGDRPVSHLLDVHQAHDGTVHILWKAKRPATSSTDGMNGIPISLPGLFYGQLDLTTGSVSNIHRVTGEEPHWVNQARVFEMTTGSVFVIWREKRVGSSGSDGLYTRTLNGTTWAQPNCIEAVPLLSPFSAIIDPSDRVFLAYWSGASQFKGYNGTTWSDLPAIPTSGGADAFVQNASLCIPTSGTVSATYEDCRNFAGIPARPYISSATYSLSGSGLSGTWSTPQVLASPREVEIPDDPYSPAILGGTNPRAFGDANGKISVIWESELAGAPKTMSDACHDLNVAFFSSGTWSEPFRIPRRQDQAYSYQGIRMLSDGTPIYAFQDSTKETISVHSGRMTVISPSQTDLSGILAAGREGDLFFLTGTRALSANEMTILANSPCPVVLGNSVSYPTDPTLLTGVVAIRIPPESGQMIGKIRQVFSKIEDAVLNVRDNETIEVSPGNYQISSKAELNPFAIYNPTGTDVWSTHTPNQHYVKGGGVKNVRLKFHPGTTVTFAEGMSGGIYLNTTGTIQGVDNITLTPSIQLVRTYKATNLEAPVIGIFSTIAAAADASEPGEAIQPGQYVGNTILLGPMGTNPAYDLGPVLLVDESLVGVQGSTRSSSTIIKVGDETTLPVVFPNNAGLLLQNLQIEANLSWLSDESDLFTFSSCGQNSTANSEYKNVVFVNTNSTTSKKGRALSVRYRSGTLKLTNCLFKNFHVGVDILKCDGATAAAAPIINGCIFDGNTTGIRAVEGAEYSFANISNCDFWQNTCDMKQGTLCYLQNSTPKTVNAVTAGANLFVDPEYVDAAQLDFRLKTKGSPGSALIDAHQNGYTDIGPFQTDIVHTFSTIADVTIDTRDGNIVSIINGQLQPHTLGSAVEFSTKTSFNLRPIYEMTFKQFALGAEVAVSISLRADVPIPSLPDDYVIATSRLNGTTYGQFVFADLPQDGEMVRKVFTSDSCPPQKVRGFQSDWAEGGVRLTWTENADQDIRGYKIYFSTTFPITSSNSTHIGSAEPGTPIYTDAIRNGSGYYGIIAYDHTGNHSPIAIADQHTVKLINLDWLSIDKFEYRNGDAWNVVDANNSSVKYVGSTWTNGECSTSRTGWENSLESGISYVELTFFGDGIRVYTGRRQYQLADVYVDGVYQIRIRPSEDDCNFLAFEKTTIR